MWWTHVEAHMWYHKYQVMNALMDFRIAQAIFHLFLCIKGSKGEHIKMILCLICAYQFAQKNDWGKTSTIAGTCDLDFSKCSLHFQHLCLNVISQNILGPIPSWGKQ